MKSEQEEGKLNLIATKNFEANLELYKIVDYLNKTLKHKKLMFGLRKDSKNNSMNISIYEI
ncbi:MAG: YpmA family protein [Bacillota bacterium]|nr:YpmA family protein [Bacillota bacterium]